MSTELVKRAYPNYNGAHLILSTVSKVSITLMIMINLFFVINTQDCSSDAVEKIVYNSRELITSFARITHFCCVVTCHNTDIGRIKQLSLLVKIRWKLDMLIMSFLKIK